MRKNKRRPGVLTTSREDGNCDEISDGANNITTVIIAECCVGCTVSEAVEP